MACVLVTVSFCTAVIGLLFEDKPPHTPTLSIKEKASIRKYVYEGGATAMPRDGQWAMQEILVVPRELASLHRQKRLSTLHLLLDIIRGGRAHDALVAAGFAHALEENIAIGALVARYPHDKVDDEIADFGYTCRDQLVEHAEELLKKANRPRER
jgi:hypothetical protein